MSKMKPTRNEQQIVHIMAEGRVWCGQMNGVPYTWPDGHTWVDTGRDATCQPCITNRKVAMMQDALEQAPAWPYDAKTATRKQLEQFMDTYCQWHNGVHNRALA